LLHFSFSSLFMFFKLLLMLFFMVTMACSKFVVVTGKVTFMSKIALIA